MKHSLIRFQRYCRRVRQEMSSPSCKSLYEEMEQGAVIGFLATMALSLYFSTGDISASLLVFFGSLGVFSGGVLGALLWIGSAQLPEDPVRAPAPGQRRRKQRD